jgi:hypothetical protein
MRLSDALPAVARELRDWSDSDEGSYRQVLQVEGTSQHVTPHRSADDLILGDIERKSRTKNTSPGGIRRFDPVNSPDAIGFHTRCRRRR